MKRTLVMLLMFGFLLKPLHVIGHGAKAAGEAVIEGIAFVVCGAACR